MNRLLRGALSRSELSNYTNVIIKISTAVDWPNSVVVIDEK